MYCCLHTPKPNQTIQKFYPNDTIIFEQIGCMLPGGRILSFSYMFMTLYLYETGVILTGNQLCKKEWLGINGPKILMIEDLRILYKVPIHLVFQRHILQVLYLRRISYHIKLLKLRDFYDHFTKILMAWWVFGDTNLTIFFQANMISVISWCRTLGSQLSFTCASVRPRTVFMREECSVLPRVLFPLPFPCF